MTSMPIDRDEPLIGRDRHLATTLDGLTRAERGHGGLLLITGEMGIGKSALTSWVVREARRRDDVAAVGGCRNDENAPVRWPWTQIARSLRAQVTPEQWAAADERAEGALAALATGDDPQWEGLGLADRLDRGLECLTPGRAVMLVVEDLQRADAESMALLDFLASVAAHRRFLLIGTCRSVDGTPDPYGTTLAHVASRASMLPLDGLDPDAVRDLLERIGGHRVGASEAAECHQRTGGNPLLVVQTATATFGSRGAFGAVPAGLREIVSSRLDALSPEVVAVLEVGAVLGRRFDPRLLARVSGRTDDTTTAAVTDAVESGVLAAVDGALEFTQDLVRQSLERSIDSDRRARLHAQAVRSVDDDASLAVRMPAGWLADQAFAAGVELDPDRVVGLLCRAGSEAAERIDAREATRHFGRALDVAARVGASRQVEVALELAEEYLQVDDASASLAMQRLALDLVKGLDDASLIAKVALVLHRITTAGGSTEAAGTAMILAQRRLFGALPDADADAAAVRVAGEAVRLAREAGDDEALTFGLWAHHDALWGPGTAAHRAALIAEIRALGDAGDRESSLYARSLEWVALLEQGDPRCLDVFREFVTEIERDSSPRAVFSAALDRCIVAVLTGDFETAHVLLGRAVEAAGDEPQAYYAAMVNHVHWSLLLHQGNVEELREFHDDLDEAGYPFPRLLAALSRVQCGALTDSEEAAQVWSVESVPRPYRALWLRLRAQIAVAEGDAESAEQALRELSPYSGEWVVSVFGCDVSGPMDLWIGLCEATCGRVEAALECLADADRSARALHARPWSLQIGWHRARILLNRGRPDDRALARAGLREVNAGASALGMHTLAAAARGLLVEIGAPDPVRTTRPAPPVQPAPPVPARTRVGETDARLQREGKVWALEYSGRTAHMSDTKGLRDLHQLLLQPGQQISSMLLYDPEGGDVARAAAAFGSDPVLDDRARAEYRARLETLEEEIARALHLERDDQAAALDRERDALLEQLRTASGLGGRNRRLGDESDRARKAVTARIKDTLRKMEEVHPELAALLRDHVSTGSSCVFSPEGVDAVWSL